MMDMGSVRHLYMHVPFCRTRCAYCDFVSEEIRLAEGERTVGEGRPSKETPDRVEEYIEALRLELSCRRPVLAAELETAYIGGGTPTVLPRRTLGSLVGVLGELLSPDGELTVEANPGTVDSEYLGALRAAGATRLSLGVQSFSPSGRAALGRSVGNEEIEEALSAVLHSGWPTWNLDLIFGIPGLDREATWADLCRVAEIRPPHVSLYDLTYTSKYLSFVERSVGPDARSRAVKSSELLYADAVGYLQDQGYRRYEVSNFALLGHECRHNLACWNGRDYLGLGAGAVSTIGAERRTNPASAAEYVLGEPPRIEVLTPAVKLYERAMLGLRTNEGVARTEIGGVLDEESVRRLVESGYMRECCDRIFLDSRGLDLCSAILAAVLRDPET